MPTPDWRYEKSSNTVKALCRVLQTPLTDDQRSELSLALHDSLKLVCDAITDGDRSRGDLWTPGLVTLFLEQPKDCARWLELLDEEDFKPDYYNPQK